MTSGPRLFAEHAIAAMRRRRPPFVLSYHGLGHEDGRGDPHGLLVEPEVFALHLDALIDGGYRLVSIADLWAAVRGGDDAGEGLGAITFHDGLAHTLHTAVALCATRGAATAFLALGCRPGSPGPGTAARIVRADQVREILARCWSARIPTTTSPCPRCPHRSARRTASSRAELETLVGGLVTTMAYPYGLPTRRPRRSRPRPATDRVREQRRGAMHPLRLRREPCSRRRPYSGPGEGRGPVAPARLRQQVRRARADRGPGPPSPSTTWPTSSSPTTP